MKSVIENEYSMEIKNSKFISLIFHINQKEEINKYLNQAKEKYPNATHYCYAYILEQEKYASLQSICIPENGNAGNCGDTKQLYYSYVYNYGSNYWNWIAV